MAIKTTTWISDHCGCELEFTWDDSVAATSRKNSISRFIKKCASHNPLSTDSSIFTTNTEENQRKNLALETALLNGPTTLYDVLADGSRQLKPTITYNNSWSGTAPNRVLTISFIGISLTNTQKTTIRNALNTRFGTGKVTLP